MITPFWNPHDKQITNLSLIFKFNEEITEKLGSEKDETKLIFEKYQLFLTSNISVQCCNEASKIFVLRRFLAEDPSSSSSLVHFKLSKNLLSFEDPKDFWDTIPSCRRNFEGILTNNGQILWMKVEKTY